MGVGSTVKRQLQGLGMLVVLALLTWFAVAVYNKALPWQASVPVSLDVSRVGHQLDVPADVELRGIIVGQVRGERTSGSGAVLDLALDRSKVGLIPPNVTAVILPKTLFGEKYVELVLPARPAPGHIGPHAVIGEDRSRVSIETETVFNDLVPLLRALRPAELSVTLSQLASALSGRGAELGDNLVRADRYFAAFDPHVPVLRADMAGLADVAASYASAAPNLLALARNFSVNARTLVAKQDTFAAFLRGTTGFADTAEQVLAQNASQLIELAAVSRPTLTTLAAYSPEFPCLLKGIDKVSGLLNDTFAGASPLGGARGLHIFLQIVAQPNGYTYPNDLPRDNQDVGPRCYGLPDHPQDTPTSRVGLNGTDAAVTAPIGLAGSASEKSFIDSLSAPILGQPSTQVSDLADLLVAPMLRGMAVSLS